MNIDVWETREIEPAETRETNQMEALRMLLSGALPKAPRLAHQLAGVDVASLQTYANLAALPVIRKRDLAHFQAENPPFAGLTTLQPSGFRRLLMSPGPIFEPEGEGKDWWGAARALYAAGFRAGDVALNTFSYHFTPGAYIMESGAQALGVAVIPAGPGQTDMQLQVIEAYQPSVYIGTPDFLKILLEKIEEAGKPAPSIKKALVSGAAFPQSLQQWVAARGVEAYQVYATAELGVIAYETSARAGLVVNEDVIVEIVQPGGDTPLPLGEVGEIVVTRLKGDYPLVRFGTGDLSKFIEGVSPCGRTGLRLAGWMGRADQRTKVKGMFVDPAQINLIAQKHPEISRLRLVITRENEQDMMLLRAESAADAAPLAAALAQSLQTITNLKGKVEIVPPNALPKDGKIIADERPA